MLHSSPMYDIYTRAVCGILLFHLYSSRDMLEFSSRLFKVRWVYVAVSRMAAMMDVPYIRWLFLRLILPSRILPSSASLAMKVHSPRMLKYVFSIMSAPNEKNIWPSAYVVGEKKSECPLVLMPQTKDSAVRKVSIAMTAR